MTGVSMRKSEQDVIYLLSCAVNEKTLDHGRVEAMNLDEVYAIASRHMISAVVAFALESAGFCDERSRKHIAKAMKRALIFKSAWEEIRAELEEKQIWYVPLKGAVLQYYYPKFGLREMADYDILIDSKRSADVKNIMEALGYTTEEFGRSNHDVYHKAPLLSFEMHTALFKLNWEEKTLRYYQGIEHHLIDGDGFEKHFTPEDFYIYIISHEYKHYSVGGIGLKLILDIYLYLEKVSLDMGYVYSELDKLALSEFEKDNRDLAYALFGGGKLTVRTKKMLDYILSSGAYGNVSNKVSNKMKKDGSGKFKYMLKRLQIPYSRRNRDYESFAKAYPFFYKYKILLPILMVSRFFRALRSGILSNELKALKNQK